MLLEKKARVSVRGHSLLRVFLMKIFSLFFFFFDFKKIYIKKKTRTYLRGGKGFLFDG